jgi:SOS response associated peptidase (SRAP)
MRPETRQRLRWQSTPEQQHGCAVRRDLVMVGPSDIRHRRLWENWKEPASEEWVRTFAIITTDANDMVSDIHDMPDILAPHDYRRWLSDERVPQDPDALGAAPTTNGCFFQKSSTDLEWRMLDPGSSPSATQARETGVQISSICSRRRNSSAINDVLRAGNG